ncbi:MAG: serine/threonine protein kinase [Deltaproteobacteria bacterium]|nr:serine/threonine protein kinase [Deltaproteobacteria bacterium]
MTWIVFFALDAFVALAVAPEVPLGWLALWRFGGTAVFTLYLIWLRRTPISPRVLRISSFCLYGFGTFLIAMMALRYHGLNSPYLQGVSIVVIMASMAVPARWQPALRLNLAVAGVFPLVMVCAAPFLPAVRAMWRSPPALARFAQDFVFVVATAITGAILSHLVWTARRQVFEARRLGRYRLKARIGSGGMGQVWMAWDEHGWRDVALKILDVSAARRTEAMARFGREARATASLRSAHTVRVFDFGASDDGVLYMALELLDGADLGALVAREGALPPARVVALARQACDSLREAHAVGIVHRDIKPENLFVTRDANGGDLLKVLDFGLAKLTGGSEDATLTQAGWAGGTPAFMAPELCAGFSADARSDVYSLGATLYFLLVGAPPFVAPSTAELIAAHLQRTPEPLSLRCRAPLAPALDQAVMRCLEKRPQDRFATIAELDLALARAASALQGLGA